MVRHGCAAPSTIGSSRFLPPSATAKHVRADQRRPQVAAAQELLDGAEQRPRAVAGGGPRTPAFGAIGVVLPCFSTASPYLGLRAEANAMFSEALGLARANAWVTLEHYVLAHWGRSLVEEREFHRARECFHQALAIRERLNDPRAATTRRALEALRELESGSA